MLRTSSPIRIGGFAPPAPEGYRFSEQHNAGEVVLVDLASGAHWSLPRPGATPEMTGHNSPLIGPKQMLTLKVGDLDSNAAATVYWSIDPRAQVGYGAR